MSIKRQFKIALIPLYIFLIFSCSAFSRGQASPQNRAAGAPEPQWQNDWSHGAVFYEVFVRSFYDSNGDGIGDLKGLVSKLDYLNDGNPATNTDLNVDALWLMPIFKSPSYHGYDTTDYRLINPQYGTNEDFAELCKQAHKRGIKIIIDYVMNHSGSDHPWFVDSASSPQSKKRNWYVWSPTNPGWRQPWSNNLTWYFKNGAYYYGLFWSGMPDLNFRNPEVRKMFRDTATFWLQKGADGFRLDATRYLVEDGGGAGQADTPETHAALKEFAAHVRTMKPQATLVGENWTETPIIAKYFGSTANVAGGDELPMNFDFPLSGAIVDGVNHGSASGISAKLAEILSLYPAGVNDAPFLTNHDQVRIATVLANNATHLKNAAAILLTLPGAPFLYYGEEVGLQNGPTQGDESKRTPMPWSDEAGGGFTTATAPWFPFAPGRDTGNVQAQSSDPNSLLSHYRNLIRARKSSRALMQGDLSLLSSTNSPQVLAFVRRIADEQVLVVHNLGDSFAAAGPYVITAISLEKIYTDPSVMPPSGMSGQWTIALPPRSTGIWRIH